MRRRESALSIRLSYSGFSVLSHLTNQIPPKSLQWSLSQTTATQMIQCVQLSWDTGTFFRPPLSPSFARSRCPHVSLPCNCLTKWVGEALRSRITSTSHATSCSGRHLHTAVVCTLSGSHREGSLRQAKGQRLLLWPFSYHQQPLSSPAGNRLTLNLCLVEIYKCFISCTICCHSWIT